MEKSAYLKEIDRIIKNGKFQDTWESLSQYRIPEWYKDTKLGIFIHWGVYSVPAFGSEWYSRNMYIQGSPEYKHHIETYGPHKDFGYKDFIPMFKAEKFDPEAVSYTHLDVYKRQIQTHTPLFMHSPMQKEPFSSILLSS